MEQHRSVSEMVLPLNVVAADLIDEEVPQPSGYSQKMEWNWGKCLLINYKVLLKGYKKIFNFVNVLK